MYAVIKTGGKQYRVQEGDVLQVEKLAEPEGSEIEFNEVLLFADGENVTIGSPVVENVSVKGRVVQQGKGKKKLVFKYKRRKGYRRKKGHRQYFSEVKIDAIDA